ncbi:outer membrane lipoprotein-sorting protein [Aquabacterium sp. A7-Y]|uniref:outer membrane lipoprotein-sorting protein n=1 Tax=Aquabacterium sp. A7-Y TaxID=1349605 RepID=UPI00223D3ABB|nr:outer membrane lipoprotein-sorting protein [Aquabacterium sp. A7-Y]MCW7540997.1 outer membrane lipoprotein-sorting protein [Aquabacterium sp. A7-Y]
MLRTAPALWCTALLLGSQTAAWCAPTADEIMQKNVMASKPRRLSQQVTMTLENARGETRQRTLDVLKALQPNGTDSNMLVRFIAPPDIKGTAFLQLEHTDSDDDQWIYLPALHKSRRLVSSNRKDSFIGSDFAYGDVLPPKVSLYRHRSLPDETVEGVRCYVVESVPASEDVKRDYGYGRKVTWVAQDSFHEVKTEYFDVTNRPLKTQRVRDIVQIDTTANRWMAKYKEMVNHQTEHKTTVMVDRYETDAKITPDTFTLRSLERD